jgi:hypothetical protein
MPQVQKAAFRQRTPQTAIAAIPCRVLSASYRGGCAVHISSGVALSSSCAGHGHEPLEASAGSAGRARQSAGSYPVDVGVSVVLVGASVVVVVVVVSVGAVVGQVKTT